MVIAHSKVRSAKRIVWRENQTELSDCVGGAGADPPTSIKMTIFLMPFALSESINLITHELELGNVSNLGGWFMKLVSDEILFENWKAYSQGYNKKSSLEVGGFALPPRYIWEVLHHTEERSETLFRRLLFRYLLNPVTLYQFLWYLVFWSIKGRLQSVEYKNKAFEPMVIFIGDNIFSKIQCHKKSPFQYLGNMLCGIFSFSLDGFCNEMQFIVRFKLYFLLLLIQK